MKKLILALLAVGSISAANAQKNTILVYGEAYVGTDKTSYTSSETKTINWGINPGIGYQFSKNLTVGLQGGFNQNRTQTENTNILGVTTSTDAFTNNYGVGAFFRYTKYVGDIFFVYGQLNAGYIGGNTNPDASSTTTTNDKYNGFGASILPGVGVFIGHGLALNFGMGGLSYRATTTDVPATVGVPGSDYSYNNSSFNFTWGSQFNIGISKNMGCGHHRGHHEMGDDMRHMDTSDDADDDAPKAKHHKKHHKEDKEKEGDE